MPSSTRSIRRRSGAKCGVVGLIFSVRVVIEMKRLYVLADFGLKGEKIFAWKDSYESTIYLRDGKLVVEIVERWRVVDRECAFELYGFDRTCVSSFRRGRKYVFEDSEAVEHFKKIVSREYWRDWEFQIECASLIRRLVAINEDISDAFGFFY